MSKPALIVAQPFQYSNFPSFQRPISSAPPAASVAGALVRPLDLSLLCGHLLLDLLFLLSMLLDLVADQGAANQAYYCAYAGAYASVARGAADNGPETCTGAGPDDRALLGRG